MSRKQVRLLERAVVPDSRATSRRQVAAIVKAVTWGRGTVNLDVGGGKFEETTDALAGLGVKNLVLDPFNRSAKHNEAVLRALQETPADTATLSNVLNVIERASDRRDALAVAREHLRAGGTLYVTVYEGNGDGRGGHTANGWQENRRLVDYLPEVRAVFPTATRNGKVITAPKSTRAMSRKQVPRRRNPQDMVKAADIAATLPGVSPAVRCRLGKLAAKYARLADEIDEAYERGDSPHALEERLEKIAHEIEGIREEAEESGDDAGDLYREYDLELAHAYDEWQRGIRYFDDGAAGFANTVRHILVEAGATQERVYAASDASLIELAKEEHERLAARRAKARKPEVSARQFGRRAKALKRSARNPITYQRPAEKLQRNPAYGIPDETHLVPVYPRKRKAKGPVIGGPEDIVKYLKELETSPVERFVVLLLDGANAVVGTVMVSQGTLNSADVHPREVFAPAITARAAAIIAAHNHPSGRAEASREDVAITKRLAEVGALVGIPLLDHVVIGRGGYTSLKAEEKF